MNDQKKLIADCQYCNSQFFPLRTSGKFCSDKCKQAAYRDRLKEKESCKLYTIGYEGKRLPEFIDTLKANGIEQLLDDRYSTKSQFKSEFSEKTLNGVLCYAGIDYTSDKRLGVPFDIQDPYKAGEMPISEFERIYTKRVSKLDIKGYAKNIKESGKTALMCYERKAIDNEIKVKGKDKFKINCHRSILANILKETEEFDEIIHL
jgi:uncharacterized protein (DUF488 family)